MPQITCSRCREDKELMSEPPFPGDLAHTVQKHVCAECWRAWLQAQVNLINEHRYVMTNADHRALLNGHMRVFLGLPEKQAKS